MVGLARGQNIPKESGVGLPDSDPPDGSRRNRRCRPRDICIIHTARRTLATRDVFATGRHIVVMGRRLIMSGETLTRRLGIHLGCSSPHGIAPDHRQSNPTRMVRRYMPCVCRLRALLAFQVARGLGTEACLPSSLLLTGLSHVLSFLSSSLHVWLTDRRWSKDLSFTLAPSGGVNVKGFFMTPDLSVAFPRRCMHRSGPYRSVVGYYHIDCARESY